MNLLIVGYDTTKAESFSPAFVPTRNDTVVTDVLTPDFYIDDSFNPGKLKLTDFKNDIYYMYGGRDCGIIRNYEKEEIFVDRPDIERID